jgi:hypothetical protein
MDCKYMTLILFGETQCQVRSPLTPEYDSLLCKKIPLFREVSRSAQREMLKVMFESLSMFPSTYKQACTGGYNTKITLPMILC